MGAMASLGEMSPQRFFGGRASVVRLSDQRSLRARAFVVARVLIGLFLLLAAGLKLHGLSRLALDGSFLSSPPMQMAAVEAEIAIGCLLLWVGILAWLGCWRSASFCWSAVSASMSP